MNASLEGRTSSTGGDISKKWLPMLVPRDTAAMPMPFSGYYGSSIDLGDIGSATPFQSGYRLGLNLVGAEHFGRAVRLDLLIRHELSTAIRRFVYEAEPFIEALFLEVSEQQRLSRPASGSTASISDVVARQLRCLPEPQSLIEGPQTDTAEPEVAADWRDDDTAIFDDGGNGFSFADLEFSTDEELIADGFPFYVPEDLSETALASLRRLIRDGPPG